MPPKAMLRTPTVVHLHCCCHRSGDRVYFPVIEPGLVGVTNENGQRGICQFGRIRRRQRIGALASRLRPR